MIQIQMMINGPAEEDDEVDHGKMDGSQDEVDVE